MIESTYWKTELFAAADRIEAKQACLRWSEKQVVLLEMEIMITLFCVRSLIERSKLTSDLATKPISVLAYPINQGKNVHLLNCCDIDDLYNLNKPQKKDLSLEKLTNQAIHSYLIYPEKDYEEKKFIDLLLCSDYDRNKHLYRVPIDSIVSVVREVAFDSPSEAHFEYDEKKKDYKITQRA